MAGVNANLSLNIDATLIGSGDLGTPKQRVNISKALSLLAGTDAVDKANILFQDQRTIAASANESLDLAGALSDAFGASIAAAEIVLIYISAAAGNINNVEFGPTDTVGAFGPFKDLSDRVVVKPGEWQLFASRSGWAVTAATADSLNFANSGAGSSVTYDVLIIGRTVAA